jgi:alpha-L-rhamnosidase
MITTGNLCTKYLLDMLTEYGYVEDAYKIMAREEYPSFGYMIQNEATTIWERFELKKNPEMNSHSHPMYGSVDYWFFAYILGAKPMEYGWKKAVIRPYYPEKLLSARGSVETPYGTLSIKWTKKYGTTQLYVTVPFGMRAEITHGDITEEVGSGSYAFVF